MTRPTRRARPAALFLALATFVLGVPVIGMTPAMAAGDQYGCRGDQACVKIAETTQCDKPCQLKCKEYRYG